MQSPQNTAAQFRFSTDAFSERERLTAWREVFGRTVVNLDIDPLDGNGFRSEATVCQLPGLGVLFALSGAVHLSHTRELIKDGDLSFMAAPTCAWSASQLGRDPVCGPGDGILMNNAEVGSMTLASASRFTTFRLPRVALAPLVSDLDAAVARPIPAADAALQLLMGYLATALDTETLVSPELQQLVVIHVYDLLAAALGATRDAKEIAKGRGVRAARLRAIKSEILANIASRNLSLDAVAARLGISPIYIRKLLEGENTSFTQFVLERRLARAHRMLSDPRFTDRAIGAVGLDVGFGDLSYFNRAFRRRYGTTPSEVRAAARDQHSGAPVPGSTSARIPLT
jgi:AraC-like DNA-binding protein